MDPQFELVGEMGLLIRREVAAGFASQEEIIRSAVQIHGGEATQKELRELAEELAGSFFHQHLQAQRGWPLVTDCDRLDLAFAQLAEKGIVIGHDLKDDGAEQFMDEMDEAADGLHPARGYVFYQRRGTEAAIDGHGLYLDYGAAGDDDDDDEDGNENERAALRIGHEVAEALRRQGLKVDWDGTLSRRIRVRLDWKRRRNWSD
ncbi:MAG: DUF6891 domain-containing protein [Pseudoxanthomonas sp.]